MTKDWNIFCKAFRDAISAVHGNYFIVRRHEDESRHFERIYCYELYHQLRTLLSKEENFPYVLHGEIDKGGHDVVVEALGAGLKPDFIVHDPGKMDSPSNLAVIEVKTIYQVGNAAGAIANIRKFMAEKMHYGHGVLLIIGDDKEVRDLPSSIPKDDAQITILWHRWEKKPVIHWGGPRLWES